jgi:hypothetical protein
MKTLVIHPEDKSTDFLKEVYSDKNWTVINDGAISKTKLKQAIKDHDRIVMMGHGTEYGLISGNINFFRYVIDSDWVYLLRDKETVCIWCNADGFVPKYELKGFYTGMIISEFGEADIYGIETKSGDIDYSNTLFAAALKESIDAPNFLESMKQKYDSGYNNVIEFNKQNLYERRF